MIKAVFLDFDGVILDSVGIKTKAFAALFEQFERDIVDKIIKYHEQNSGVSRFDKFRYIYHEFLNQPLSEEHFNKLCERFSELVFEEIVIAGWIPGAKEFIEKNCSKYSLFVVSATPNDEIRGIIKKRGLSKYFIDVVGSPSPKKFLVKKLLEKYNFNPSEVLFVGDSYSDYEAALINMIWFVGVEPAMTNTFSDRIITINNLTSLESILAKFENTDAGE